MAADDRLRPARAPTRSACASSTSAWCCRRSGCTAALPKAEIARADQPHRADGAAHHRAARGRRPGAQARAGARQGRPALGADGAEPGRRLFDRHQDRPAQPGHAAGRLHRRRCASASRWPTTFPDPDTLFDEIRAAPAAARASRSARSARGCLHGVGIAAPLSLGGWQTLLGIAPEQAAKWAGIDIRERVAAMTELPVEFVKDTAAACVAELVAGRGRSIAQLSLRLRRHLHRRRPGDRQPPARRRAAATPARWARCRSGLAAPAARAAAPAAEHGLAGQPGGALRRSRARRRRRGRRARACRRRGWPHTAALAARRGAGASRWRCTARPACSTWTA